MDGKYLFAVVSYQGNFPTAQLDMESRFRTLASLDPRIRVSHIKRGVERIPYCLASFGVLGEDSDTTTEEFKQLLRRINDDGWLIWRLIDCPSAPVIDAVHCLN